METKETIEATKLAGKELAKFDAAFPVIAIKNDSDLQLAASLDVQVRSKIKELEETRMSITRPLDAAKKAVMGLFAPHLEKLEAFQKENKRGIIAYEDEQAERRRKEQEEENARAAKAAEAQRDRLLDTAEQALEAGDSETAERLANKADTVHAQPVNMMTANRKGTTIREIVKFEIFDPSLLPREYTLPNEAMIGAVGRSTKGKASIPGVRFYTEKV